MKRQEPVIDVRTENGRVVTTLRCLDCGAEGSLLCVSCSAARVAKREEEAQKTLEEGERYWDQRRQYRRQEKR